MTSGAGEGKGRGLGRRRGVVFLIDSAEQLEASGDVFLFGAIGEKTEMADALKAAGKHVEKKAADEFVGVKSHGPLFTGFPVPVEEGHLAIGDVNDPAV